MILLDTSGLLAALDESDPDHTRAARSLRGANGPGLLSPFVLAELDQLVSSAVSREAQRAVLAEVARGAFRLESFLAGDIDVARAVMERYPKLELDLADASIVVLSYRHDVADVLTLDEDRFRRLRRSGGRAFRLLPADG